MTLIELARKLRPLIEKASASLDDVDALDGVQLFPVWSPAGVYAAGERVSNNGILYRCLQGHTAQETWNPVDAPSLWAKVLIPDPDVIPAWEQPDSTNPYMKGDKVTHNGKTWTSDVDNNVWQPGVYGWTEVLE
jgi:chitodextrinase